MRLINLQSFSTAKEINKVKIQPIILDEKTSANDATSNGLISKNIQNESHIDNTNTDCRTAHIPHTHSA